MKSGFISSEEFIKTFADTIKTAPLLYQGEPNFEFDYHKNRHKKGKKNNEDAHEVPGSYLCIFSGQPN